MTTYSLNAFTVTYEPFTDEANSLTPTQVQISFSEGVSSFTYTVTEAASEGELPIVEVDDEQSPGDLSYARIDGSAIPDTTEVAIGYITTAAGTT